MREIKDRPSPESWTAKNKPALRSGARHKVTYNISPYAHDQLRLDADRRGTRQAWLLDTLLRKYLDPESVHYDHDL